MLDGHTLYGYLPGGASGGILPASMADMPLDFDTLNAVRLLHRLGGDRGAVGQGHGAGAARNVMKFFADESCGQCTPCRVGTVKALQLMNERHVGRAAPAGAVAGDDGRVDLRPGPGGAEPGAVRAEVLPEGSRVMHQKNTAIDVPLVTFTLNGQTVVAPRRPDDSPDRRRSRHRDSAPLLHGRHARGRQLPHLHGGDQGRARARRRPAAAIPRTGWRSPPTARGRVTSQKMSLELLLSDMPGDVLHARLRARSLGEEAGHRQAALRTRVTSRPKISRIRRWPCTSTPASSASAACAPAAKSRSTTSSATRSAAATRRSCSTSTIRWATRRASPAASACRRARPAR